MNKRGSVSGLLYSLVVIIFKLVILLGGFTLTKFGFYYANVVAVFFVIPFLFLAIYQVREKDFNGIIGGREAFRVALTVLAVGAIILSAYNYLEFNWKYKDIAVQYYNSSDYINVLTEQQIKNPDKIKTENFPAIINEQITSLSATRSTTAKLFPYLLIGLTGSFFASVLMKKSSK